MLETLEAEALRGARGRREKVRCTTGRYLRAEPYAPDEPLADLAADASLRAAALAALSSDRPLTLPLITRQSLRRKVRIRARKALVVFAVDASESMAAEERMSIAKGAALAFLRSSYLRRDHVAVVVFEGESARVLLEPTPSIERARERLRRLPIGGATPLAAGLWTAWRLINAERLREPEIVPTLVLLSDGRANVPMEKGVDPHREVLSLADRIRADGISVLAVDAGSLYPPHGELVELAEHLGGALLRVGRGSAGTIAAALRT